MKLKKAIVALAAIWMMSVAFACVASAERVKVSTPEVSTADSMTTVTYTLTEAPAGEKATLIAMYVDSESGKILAVNSVTCEDVSSLADGKISITLPDKSADGGVLNHYIMKDLNHVIWLNDLAPTMVENLSASRDGVNPGSKINLSWNASDDDWDNAEDLKYNIYDMGLLLKENVTDTKFSAENLNWGSRHNFKVEAVDLTGKASQISSDTEIDTIIPYTISTTDKVTSTDSNLIFTSNPYEMQSEEVGAKWYFCYENAVIDNLPCVATTRRDSQGTFHSVRVSTDLAAKLKAGTDVVFEIEYWSDNNDRMKIEMYGTEDGTEKNTQTSIAIKNDGKWNVLTQKITLKYDFESAGRKNHNYSHFRFTGGATIPASLIPLNVRRITFMPLSVYNEMNPERDAYLDVQAGIIHNGLKLSGTPEIEVVGESYAVKAEGLTVLTESEVKTANAKGIEVLYYAPEGVESFTINGETVEVTENGCWQRAKVTLDGGLSGSSFMIDGDVYINNIRLNNGLPALS